MHLSALDWSIVVLYILFAVVVGIRFAKRAGQDVNEFFLSGRTLPWWVAGTSMVATTFAADTPLVITGWVRDHGIWKNWLWMCFAAGGFLTVFLFARYWRRGEVMTTAELAELRYGGSGAKALRGFLGFFHAGVLNTIILCWVILAAVKIMDVLLEVDKITAVAVACMIALGYSLLSGFWGVVFTDLVQFAMAMAGAVLLAMFSWEAVDGSAGVLEAAARGGSFKAETLAFFPSANHDSGWLDRSFWSANLTAVLVYLGVSWWAFEGVDGGGLVVQRISASRDEKSGVLAVLWYNVAHYALRPWPWILVAIASLVVLPHVEVKAPVGGTVIESSTGDDAIFIAPTGGGEPVRVDLLAAAFADDWVPQRTANAGTAEEPTPVAAGEIIARTDSERAYVVMMKRFLPSGLLGLAVAALLAAFMSTIDTHVNLASSFFVNDVYRRFLVRKAPDRHYVFAARAACVVVLAMAGVLAYFSASISDLFTFFLAFLGGVGPVYILRWLWWRVRASTEITAIIVSSVTAVYLKTQPIDLSIGQLIPDSDGLVAHEVVMCVVAAASIVCALLSMAVTRTPDPESLVGFYRKVRPMGAWGPVRALCPEVEPEHRVLEVVVGIVSGLAATYGLMLGIGFAFLDRGTGSAIALTLAAAGAVGVSWSLTRILGRKPADHVSTG